MQRRLEFRIGTETLVGDIHLPNSFPEPFPCVITSHGYKSHRDSDKYCQIGHRFPLEGIAIYRFDHRGALNGESNGEFEDTTLSMRIEDVLAAIDAVAEIPEINSTRVGLLGSSLGGMDVLMARSDRVKARVVMATPFTFPPPPNEMKSAFREKGYYDYSDGTRINKEFYEDVQRYNLQEEVEQTKCPLLIIHGYLDELVPHHHAEVLYKAAGSEIKDLKMIEGGDHAFSELDKLNEVLGHALNWFKKYL
ncbi:alpha/beta hydrolase [Chloroflexota bacterium]